MSDMEAIDLDALAEDIIAAVAAAEGEVETSDLREELLPDDDSARSKLYYRIHEYLEPEGLVETRQPDSGAGRKAAKRISITERGEEYVANHSDVDPNTMAVDTAERVAALEDRIDALEAENERLREQLAGTESAAAGAAAGGVDEDTIAELEQRLDELDDYARGLDEDITKIMNGVDPLFDTVDELEQTVAELDSHPLLRDGEGIAAVNRALILGNTLQVLLNGKDLITAEMVEDQYERRAQVLAENNRLLPDE